MCGICGFVGNQNARWEDDTVRRQTLERMKETLIHRGPDQGGSWVSEYAALGFRRLGIIDLESGEQPIVNETGDKVLLFNGEIYNYRKLRQELVEAGHSFRSMGDSEVVLHGYEEWGESLPEHLRGMFAFVIWDESGRQLYAARDPFGIKPFYYTLAEGHFVFASEIKGILPYPAYRKRLNEEALEQYLSFQYSVLEETFFKGIFKLLPGHFLRYGADDNTVHTAAYFVPKPDPERAGRLRGTKPCGRNSRRHWIERIDHAVEESVEAHMTADVEVGAFLSGGVDSCLVAAEFTGKKVFTVGFGSRANKYNEIDLAKGVASKLHLKHYEKRISEREFWDVVPEVLYYMDEPSGDPSAVPLYFLAREAARQVKVVLSGEGADEFFGGYRIYCEPNALRLYQKLPETLRKRIAEKAEGMPKMKGQNFLIRGGMPVEERFIGNANLFTEAERKRLLLHGTQTPSPQELLAADYGAVRDLDEASRMQYIDLLHWLPGDILQKADRMSMAHSLELRVPYLDREVFEAARYLPEGYKQKGQTSKYLFRQVAKQHLTGSDSGRKKLGFPVPLGSFLKSGTGSEMLRKAFDSPAAARFFDREVLEELLARRGNGRGNTNRKIWAVYAFLVWYGIYFSE